MTTNNLMRESMLMLPDVKEQAGVFVCTRCGLPMPIKVAQDNQHGEYQCCFYRACGPHAKGCDGKMWWR